MSTIDDVVTVRRILSTLHICRIVGSNVVGIDPTNLSKFGRTYWLTFNPNFDILFSNALTTCIEFRNFLFYLLSIKIICDKRFQRAFTSFGWVFKVITLIWVNPHNYFENATACSKCTLKTCVATQLLLLNGVGGLEFLWGLY